MHKPTQVETLAAHVAGFLSPAALRKLIADLKRVVPASQTDDAAKCVAWLQEGYKSWTGEVL